MGEIVALILRWAIRISFFGIVAVAWTVIITTVITQVLLPINGSLITDVMGTVQIWAPFHISSIIAYILLASSAYLTYRIALMIYHFINMFIGKN